MAKTRTPPRQPPPKPPGGVFDEGVKRLVEERNQLRRECDAVRSDLETAKQNLAGSHQFINDLKRALERAERPLGLMGEAERFRRNNGIHGPATVTLEFGLDDDGEPYVMAVGIRQRTAE